MTDSPDYPVLPEGLVLGASTASYQIEGAVTEDGRGPSVWDTFTAQPGRVRDGSTGAVTCDHYHRTGEDVALMRELGLGGYRFSIAWPRVQPTGSGAVNPAGLGFYDRLVDELLAGGIAPMATLFHWDLPQALEDAGGWRSRETAERFGEYAAVVAEQLADRVAYWCPVNEPNVVTMLGYALGRHAPGGTDGLEALPVAHHLLLGHGRAVAALRAAGAAQVGTATNHTPVWTHGESEADRDAARAYDEVWNRLFADPVLLGSYPESLVGVLPVAEGDLAAISAPLDFYGLNYYFPTLVGAHDLELVSELGDLPVSVHEIEGYPTTDFGWPVVPDGLREVLVELQDRYPDLPPVHVTENGCSYEGLQDDFRIDYLDGHLRAVGRAIAEGVDVRGYWTWSLLDNFEWAEGFTQRFGLVHVDYDTLARTRRKSFRWYAGLIASRSFSS